MPDCPTVEGKKLRVVDNLHNYFFFRFSPTASNKSGYMSIYSGDHDKVRQLKENDQKIHFFSSHVCVLAMELSCWQLA